jgi:hypothetical protein
MGACSEVLPAILAHTHAHACALGAVDDGTRKKQRSTSTWKDNIASPKLLLAMSPGQTP